MLADERKQQGRSSVSAKLGGIHIMEPMIMLTTSFMRAPAPTSPR